MRNYFLIKAELANNLKDAYNSLRGLKIASTNAPFLHV
jgi:hypothetical protein